MTERVSVTLFPASLLHQVTTYYCTSSLKATNEQLGHVLNPVGDLNSAT